MGGGVTISRVDLQGVGTVPQLCSSIVAMVTDMHEYVARHPKTCRLLLAQSRAQYFEPEVALLLLLTAFGSRASLIDVRLLQPGKISDCRRHCCSPFGNCAYPTFGTSSSTASPSSAQQDWHPDDQQFYSFNPPYYMPLKKSRFDTLDIQLNTDWGAPFPFTDDPNNRVCCRVHFRKRKSPTGPRILL